MLPSRETDRRNFGPPPYGASARSLPALPPQLASLLDSPNGAVVARMIALTRMSGGSVTPQTYDADRHEVSAIIATESPIQRVFGSEVLKIRRDAVDLDLLDRGQLPLLDAHHPDRMLGRVVDVRFQNRQLRARLRFDNTPRGREAETKVVHGRLFLVSCRAAVQRWTCTDEDNDVRVWNTNFSSWGGDASNRTFTAARWRLIEVSLTTEPSDMDAVIL
jgi:phage head maturation protease